MRGAPAKEDLPARYERIIPAYAGSTSNQQNEWMNPQDHPRVCGEHFILPRPLHFCGGSSPRMRGALLVPLLMLKLMGIIPAYAGSTP